MPMHLLMVLEIVRRSLGRKVYNIPIGKRRREETAASRGLVNTRQGCVENRDDVLVEIEESILS